MARELRVLIPTAGRPRLIQRTLESLAACQTPAIYRETIVVENGPRCGAEDIVEKSRDRLNARYMHVERANKSNALNVVLAKLPEDCLVYFVDDDIRFGSQTLMEYARVSEGANAGWLRIGEPRQRGTYRAVHVRAGPKSDDAELTSPTATVVVSATIEGEIVRAPVILTLRDTNYALAVEAYSA